MRLFDLPAGMHTRIVRIFLAEKGLQLPISTVDMTQNENRRPDFLAKSPFGEMPVLEVEDGVWITESIAICRYLEELHPEPRLFGVDALDRAKTEMWARRMELEIARPLGEAFRHLSAFYAGRIEQIAAVGEAARAHALDRLAWLDGTLADREFVAGARYTIADIVAQAAMVLAKNTGVTLSEDQTNLLRWFRSVSARPTARA